MTRARRSHCRGSRLDYERSEFDNLVAAEAPDVTIGIGHGLAVSVMVMSPIDVTTSPSATTVLTVKFGGSGGPEAIHLQRHPFP